MNSEVEKDIVLDILAILLDRKGFDWWWEDLEDELQQEIEQECILAVKERLK